MKRARCSSFEAGVGTGYHVGGDQVGGSGEVQPAVTTGHRHTHQPGVYRSFDVFLSAGSVLYASVHYLGAFVVYALGVGGYRFGADLADDLQHFVVAVDGIFVVYRGVIVCVLIGKSAFFQLHDPLHQGIGELELQFRGICINFVCNT